MKDKNNQEDNRPDPEVLLQRFREQESKQNKGKLKIYLGAAPGVGKTYAMLKYVINKRKQKLDIVAGVLESHGRHEIELMLKEIEILPKKTINYKGKNLLEFDLDMALKRKPNIILMDEMAHTNAPGSRHKKRWQDIEELLNGGIDVHTTLNVQHIESFNDIVSQVLQVAIKETVPDSMLEKAENIELVDLSPDELIKRLQEGKVYFQAQAKLAKDNFFRKGNLIALRELALKVTSESVNAQALSYRKLVGIQKIWPIKQKILVCVGAREDSLRLIRIARRMAISLHADWFAIHVETPKNSAKNTQKNHIIRNLKFAEQMGAKTQVISGLNIVYEIINFAREENITQIVLFKHIRPKIYDIIFTNLADELIRNSGEIDIYVVTHKGSNIKTHKSDINYDINNIVWPFAIVAGASTIDIFLQNMLNIDKHIILIYMLSVITVSFSGKKLASILSSILAPMAYMLLNTPDAIFSRDLLFIIIIMLVISQVIVNLTTTIRRYAEMAKLAARHTAALHNLSRQLAGIRGINKIIEVALHYVEEAFDSEVLIFMLNNIEKLEIKSRKKDKVTLDEKEIGVAQWVYDAGRIAGLGTDTLSYAQALYVPLEASQGRVGVLRLHPLNAENIFSPEKMHLLESCANQIALALEVDRLAEKDKKLELKTVTNKARTNLLKLLSFDLRQPIASVMKTTADLIKIATELGVQQIRQLGSKINFDMEQLNSVVNNLLQITYLETDAVKLHKKQYSLQVIMPEFIAYLASKLQSRKVNFNIPDDLPLVKFDSNLMQEVINNLIDNILKYTPVDTEIEISASNQANYLLISIADNGPGILPEDINKLFDKLYKGKSKSSSANSSTGLGLGLTICKNIIEAHGGRIWAENRSYGGAIFSFTLPL